MKLKRMTAVVLAAVMLLTLWGCAKERSSIGIIGGADGPTAIFITTGD